MEQEKKLAASSDYLTYADASQVLNVKVNTLYAWVSRRVIPFVRLGPRVVRFRRQDIDEWVNERSVQPVQASDAVTGRTHGMSAPR